MADEDLETMPDDQLSAVAVVFDSRGLKAKEILARRRTSAPMPKIGGGSTSPPRPKVSVRATSKPAVSRWSFVGTMLVVGTLFSRIRKTIIKIKFPKFTENGGLSMTTKEESKEESKVKKVVYWLLAIIIIIALSSVGGKMIYDKGQRDAQTVVSSEDEAEARFDRATAVKVNVGYMGQFELPVAESRWLTRYFVVEPNTEFAAYASDGVRIDVGFYDEATDLTLWKGRNVYWPELKKLPVAGDVVILRPHEHKPCTIYVYGSKLR